MGQLPKFNTENENTYSRVYNNTLDELFFKKIINQNSNSLN